MGFYKPGTLINICKRDQNSYDPSPCGANILLRSQILNKRTWEINVQSVIAIRAGSENKMIAIFIKLIYFQND